MRVVRVGERTRRFLAVTATLAVVLPLAWMWWDSRLPDRYDPASTGYVDLGGGPAASGGHGHHHATAVADLVEDRAGPADVAFTLTVRDEGRRITVNGGTPGPTLRVRQRDLVEVTLVNAGVAEGITLHWHGLDVPNAMDGVAGVTQDAVAPGESFVYRFVADQVGTYWYHSHQVSHEQVRRGLFGALVVEDPAADPVQDVVALLHEYDAVPTLDGEPGATTVPARAGDAVRVRVVNTDNALTAVWVTGAPYVLAAIDGIDLHDPSPVTARSVAVTAGGRADLLVTVPAGGLRLDFGGTTTLVLGHDPTGSVPPQPDEFVDLLTYGSPGDPGPDPAAADRVFDYSIGRRLGFLDGVPGRWWTINGHLFPGVPMFMVEEGDVVVMRIENHSGESHPMHLHGHHALVVSRNGAPSTGSPWWVDSLEVGTGESYVIVFRADNPGIWMDHCHNLPHAAEGLVAHLMYTGVRSSFVVGDSTGNRPE
jgi:FtsP/CotA-like multicopper oxidase with cupredoxin domain